ncbi:hypothetical protein JCM6882_006397 [Rhodosporidiobolus microsporus]
MPAASIPTVGPHLVVSVPQEKTLLLRLNRPEALNAMTDELEADICKVLDWFEEEPSLWAVVVTGTGRAFCAGQDLKNWLKTTGTTTAPDENMKKNVHGFGSLARRLSKKPIIVALNGHAYGGGAEVTVNGDIVIGCQGAKIGFPEVLRGVVAGVGGIPNAYLHSPTFAPYLLTGQPLPQSLLETHLFTEVVPAEQVLPTALAWAKKLTAASPEAVWATKQQINLHKAGNGINEVVMKSIETELSQKLYRGDNIKEGLRSFVEKRNPVWKDPPRLTGKAKL